MEKLQQQYHQLIFKENNKKKIWFDAIPILILLAQTSEQTSLTFHSIISYDSFECVFFVVEWFAEK